MDKPALSLIGAGAAGRSLLLALGRLGFPLAAISSRSTDSARRCAAECGAARVCADPAEAARAGELVIIATPDSAIETVCETIARADGFRPGQLVLHLSGALASSALESAARRGADTLAFHPVQTLAEPQQGAAALREAWFCLEGSATAIARGAELAAALSGRHVVIPAAGKPLYHAALCFASNYLVTLEGVAANLLTHAGIDRTEALPLLLPLLRGALENLQHCGIPKALTGPISRGDATTVERHLSALDTLPGTSGTLYRQLGLATLALARSRGGSCRRRAHHGSERASAIQNGFETQCGEGIGGSPAPGMNTQAPLSRPARISLRATGAC
ncbi:MAG: DUF2520 domain-containing protein [Candidatus Sedimenticola endophacoides]